MNKKIIGIIIALVVICVVGIGAFFLFNNKSNNNENTNDNSSMNENINNEQQDNETNVEENENNNITSDKTEKVLVVYFSATNNTKSVAEKIAKNLNGDLFEIVPENEYTSEDLNYGNSNSRVSKEHDDERLRNVKLKTTKVDNWDSYDTILIGYPIWWQVAAWPVDTFVKANNFNGKIVIPFCTSASSGLGQSGKLLESISNGGKWLEGHRFSSRPSETDIKTFTDSVK
ncbi:MAG: flavodoxin [Ruminococcus sp.]|nr:flavodoxin [Ruminococcus sp.]